MAASHLSAEERLMREAAVLEAIKRGMSKADIARFWGCSRQNIDHIAHRARRRQMRQKEQGAR